MSILDSPNGSQKVIDSFLAYCNQNIGLYESPKGYVPWNNFLKTLVEAVTANKAWNINANSHPLEKAFMTILLGLSTIQPPVRYVGRELIEAWYNTRLPTLTHNRPYVLPAFILFPPLPSDLKKPPLEPEPHVLVVVELDSGELMVWAMIAERSKNDPGIVSLSHSSFAIEPGVDLNDWTGIERLVASLAVNAWLIHTYEPELITQEPVCAPSGRGFGLAKEGRRQPIAPTWIGRRFKIRRERQPLVNEHGVKVRPHWRSGHWHTVRHGKGRQEERLQWYRPVYVNS